jgi:ferrochelatase
LVIVPLYVLHSDFTDGITARDLRTYQAQAKQPLPPTTLLSFRPHLDTLAEIMAGYIRTQVRALGLTPEACRETALLCGCHGTGIHPPKGIEDTGYEDTYGLFCRIEAQLRDEFGPIAIGWLNHRLGGDWTSPTLEQSAKAVQAEGIRSVVYYPFGFLGDNAETCLEGKVVLREVGIESYHHLPCLNTDPAFIRFLAEVVGKEG